MKRLFILLVALVLCAMSVQACMQLPAEVSAAPMAPGARVIARGAPIHGANGLYFDRHDRLHIASVSGREIVVMDPDSGRILDRIGPERGVESPDDLTFGPDGSLYWTALLTGEVGKLTPDGKKVIVAQGLMGANPITFSEDGRLFVARDFMGDGLYELDPNGVNLAPCDRRNAGRSEWLRLRA